MQDAKKVVQQGRSEVRDAKNNERHVCGRARDVSAQCLRGEEYAIITRSPIACMNRRLPRPYVEPLRDARTPLADFSRILLADSALASDSEVR